MPPQTSVLELDEEELLLEEALPEALVVVLLEETVDKNAIHSGISPGCPITPVTRL